MAKQYLYREISAFLREAILAGEYAADEMIPSENELAAKYSTSRVTIRKSLQVLENEGMIKPWQGKGYFVQQPKHTVFTMHFGDTVGRYNPRFQKISISPAEGETAFALSVPVGRMVIETRRVLEKDGQPVGYDEKFIPYERGVPSVEMEINFAEFPDVFADKFVPMSIWTDMEIGAETAPDYVCRAMGVSEGTVMMTVYRYIKTMNGECIGFGRQYLSEKYGKIKAQSGYYVNGASSGL